MEASLPKNIPERSRKIADHSFSLIHHPNRQYIYSYSVNMKEEVSNTITNVGRDPKSKDYLNYTIYTGLSGKYYLKIFLSGIA